MIIRSAEKRDVPYLYALFAEDEMATPQETELLEGLVAINDVDEPVGFIRIKCIEDAKSPRGNGNYVYPIIVFKSWQGHGVGSALIKHAQQRYGELKLVACKASQGFYPTCGFTPLVWSEVASQIAADCTECPSLKSCTPQPYVLRDQA